MWRTPLEVGIVPRDALRGLGTALGALDRVRFLSERLRTDMLGELRFSAAEARATGDGIDVASLELDAADLAAMDVLRTGAGMDLLASLGRGAEAAAELTRAAELAGNARERELLLARAERLTRRDGRSSCDGRS
jgi:hypothetical protein